MSWGELPISKAACDTQQNLTSADIALIRKGSNFCCVWVFKCKRMFAFQSENKTCSPLSEWLLLRSCSVKQIFGFPSGFVSASPLWFKDLNFFGVMLLNMVGCFFPQIVQKNSTPLKRHLSSGVHVKLYLLNQLILSRACTKYLLILQDFRLFFFFSGFIFYPFAMNCD